jgi:penicillin amidase
LGAVPFEYVLLRAKPESWTAEDTVLTVFAMYVSLQETNGITERQRGNAREVLGQPLADFLFPEGTSWDAPLDGSSLPTPAMPSTGSRKAAALVTRVGEVEPAILGSNAFAVGGALSSSGVSIVANDMHLGLRVPNIWYRARLVLDDGSGRPALDITGITLPGAPTIVAGSNGRIAWGFTNSYVDTSDVVVLEPVDGSPNRYRTPEGPKELSRVQEQLCRSCRKPEELSAPRRRGLPVEEGSTQRDVGCAGS